MSENKFTPGPWERNIYSHGGSRIFVGNTLIADTYHAEDLDLIFAAPEMYEALKAVIAVADRKTVEFDMARAALAKAEGRP